MFENLKQRNEFFRKDYKDQKAVAERGAWLKAAAFRISEPGYTDDLHRTDCARLAIIEMDIHNGVQHPLDNVLRSGVFHFCLGFCSGPHEDEHLSDILGKLAMLLLQQDYHDLLTSPESDEAVSLMSIVLTTHLSQSLAPHDASPQAIQEGVRVAMEHGMMQITPNAVADMWKAMKVNQS